MIKSELRANLKKLLRTICDNVDETFVFPEERAHLNGAFPYITIVFGDMDFDGSSQRFIQRVSVIGFVKGTEQDLINKQDDLETKIFRVLYKNGSFQCNINSGSNTNIFKPFGFDAGIFAPYAGIRFELEIPQVKVIP